MADKKELSARQREHLAKLAQANRERRGIPEPKAIIDPPPAGEEPLLASDVMARFAQLGAALQDVSATQTQRLAQIDEFERIASKLSIKDYPELATNPTIQQFVEAITELNAERKSGDPPGTIYNRGQLNEAKRPWTWRDLARWGFRDPVCREKGKDCPNCGGEGACVESVMIAPNESTTVTWNGLGIRIVADIEQWIPRPHYNVYRETLRARETARQHADYIFRGRDRISGQADPSVISAASVEVRAKGMAVLPGQTVGYRPGAGGFNPYEPEGGSGES